MYPSKKPLRFVKIFVFLRAVFSEILHEILPFALFFVKKQLKKHDVPFETTVTFYEKCRSIVLVFSENLSEISRFGLFWDKKPSKK